ncbi:MAG TPA: hypothetical protein DCE44_10720, partial [Verrucomicrobiales bacterium]|nr:hypothetical protein [Verrucomicrobiales bacterium]
MNSNPLLLRLVLVVLAFSRASAAPNETPVETPSPHRQLPKAMHGTMAELPRITVGQNDGDLRGSDHRTLQAAVDYIASLGGGVVE